MAPKKRQRLTDATAKTGESPAKITRKTMRTLEGAKKAGTKTAPAPGKSVPKEKKETSLKKENGTTSTLVYTHWLVKSEPESRFEKGVDVKFSFNDLKSEPDQTACWDGVRNYQARRFLRDEMKCGHDVFFYHSNCKEPGIVGICKVVKEGYVDHTQFDSKDPHFDSSSQKDQPKWFMVDVKYVRPLKRFIPLAELKKIHLTHAQTGGPLRNIALFKQARLSVQPVSKEEWDFIVKLEDSSPS